MRFLMISFALIAFATKAPAVPITFIETGNGSGTINGVAFASTGFTVTSTGDTAARQLIFGNTFNIPNVTSVIKINGVGTYSINSQTETFVNFESHIVGDMLGMGVDSNDLIEGPTNAQFATWTMQNSIGPLNGDVTTLLWNFAPVTTSGGTLVFADGVAPGSFQAIVPEPSTAALLVIGCVGALVVRRRSASGQH